MMRILGRSKGRCIISHTDSYSHSSSFNSSRSAPFMHFSRCTHAISERESSYHPSLLTKVYKKGKQLYQNLRGLREGDTVDLNDLLFTKDRDYLIKCNGGQQVKAEQLVGKVVVIYFDSILYMDKRCLKSLMHAYNDLHPKNIFEVVFVDIEDSDATRTLMTPHKINDELFINEFPTMPWTAIPLSDIPSRKHLRQSFCIPERIGMGYLFVINSEGIILQWNAVDIFYKYGAAGYPFTSDKINQLKSEDDVAIREPSLNALLASRERNYLISNKGEKVPIDTLKDKVVALFFYTEYETHQNFTEILKVAYEELREKNNKFEVVLIYLYDSQITYPFANKETFSNTFKTMPWLALPFGDPNHKKLKRLFFLPWECDKLEYGLIVIGPHMEFIQPYGLSILEDFGSAAYPFSWESVAELVTQDAKKLELKMLWDPDGVLGGKYGTPKVKLDQFVGKRVIVLYDCYGVPIKNGIEVIPKLKERYDSRGTDDEFEVIHITWEANGSLKSPSIVYGTELPWFVEPVHDYTDESKFFGLHCTYASVPSLLAFDRDGRIVRKTLFPTFDETKFPFYSGGMEKEALSQLFELYEWDWLRVFYPGTIYSSEKICDRRGM